VIHAEGRAGWKKVASAAAAIRALNSEVEVVAYDEVSQLGDWNRIDGGGAFCCEGIERLFAELVDLFIGLAWIDQHDPTIDGPLSPTPHSKRPKSPSPPPPPRGSCGATTWWWTRATTRPHAIFSTTPASSSPRYPLLLLSQRGGRGG
jgi:hypothetical protein